MAKNGSDLCNFYSREHWIFEFFYEFFFFLLLFFTNFKSLMFHNKIVKISESLDK